MYVWSWSSIIAKSPAKKCPLAHLFCPAPATATSSSILVTLLSKIQNNTLKCSFSFQQTAIYTYITHGTLFHCFFLLVYYHKSLPFKKCYKISAIFLQFFPASPAYKLSTIDIFCHTFSLSIYMNRRQCSIHTYIQHRT